VYPLLGSRAQEKRGPLDGGTGNLWMTMESSATSARRMGQSLDQYEVAFEQEAALERRRRQQLRQRAANRSRARRIARDEQRGKIRFSVLFTALTATVVTVVIVMFEILAWVITSG
jgi:hypothetical protein